MKIHHITASCGELNPREIKQMEHKKAKNFIFKYKFIAAIVLVGAVWGGYKGYKALAKGGAETRYVLASVEKSTVIASISGNGQVAASDQIDIKPKVSGDVASVLVKSGQEVKAGDILVQLDGKDANKAIRDAKANLDNAKLSMQKLTEPASDIDIMEAENALAKANDNLAKLLNPDEDVIKKAENDLESARNNLEKFKCAQSANYQKALDAKQKAEDDLAEGYEDSYNSVSGVFMDLPDIMAELYKMLFSYDIGKSETAVGVNYSNDSALANTISYSDWEDRDEIEILIENAKKAHSLADNDYDENFSEYKDANRNSNREVIENLLDQTIETVRKISDVIRSQRDLFDFWAEYRGLRGLKVFEKVKSYQNELKDYTSKNNNNLSSLLSMQKKLDDFRSAIADAEQNLAEMDRNNPIDLKSAETAVDDKQKVLDDLKNPDSLDISDAQLAVKQKEDALKKLKAGPDEMDIRSQQLSIQQRQDALNDAREKLAEYAVKAPFDGVITSIDVKKGDALSTSAVITTLMTKQRMAEISLNEVDAAKIKVGQKATLMFDAASELTLTGTVAEIDASGTVSQGVVTYNAKIIFDAEDDRIKPGMSVAASIMIDVKQDVLAISNSAVKSSGDAYYVEILENIPESQILASASSGIASKTAPKRQPVQIGMANDSVTEITSGLKEGDQVIIRTIAPTTATTQTSSQSSILQMGGNASRNSSSGTFKMMR